MPCVLPFGVHANSQLVHISECVGEVKDRANNGASYLVACLHSHALLHNARCLVLMFAVLILNRQLR